MRSLFATLVLILLFNAQLPAQCISGDCINGIGTYRYENGDMYTGQWVNGLKDGNGKYDWTDGSYYIGYFKNDMRDGQGIYHGSDGTHLEGSFSKGELVPVYGCTEGNCQNGKGTYKFNNGDTYNGDWVNGVRTGKGRYDWANGSYYTGDFKDNKLHGTGSYYAANGSTKIGKFENNNFIEGAPVDEEPGDKSKENLLDEMERRDEADQLALKEAISTAVKKDFCSTVQSVTGAYASNFESLLGPEQKSAIDIGNSWYANLMVENSVEAGISEPLLSTSKSYYNILLKTDDFNLAQTKYNDFVKQLNDCAIACCNLVYDTDDFKGENLESYLTYWLPFTVNNGYKEETYKSMVVEVELQSNIIGPKWSLVFRVYKFEAD